MASLVTTSTNANSLKETLDEIITDPTDGYDSKASLHQWMDESSMDDNYVDDLESAGPGLIAEKVEGEEMATGTIKEGVMTRYRARTYALKLLITEEAIEDEKYEQCIDAARRLKRALWKTADLDATLVAMRGFSSTQLGGDGVPLWSTSHSLPHGGVFSNIMATPLAPSVAAVVVARAMAMQMPGHDGITEGYELEKIILPVQQWSVWSALLGSKFTPESGNFAEINVVNSDLNLTAIPLKFWTNSTTNYAFITDCDNGFKWKWRKKPRTRTWMENSQEIMSHSIRARWDRKWSDPRCTIGVNA